MSDVFTIGSTKISENHPPYVIAEIGVNHDGSVDRGLELVVEAAQVGANAVKFQWFTADDLVSHGAETAEYQKSQGIDNQHALLQGLELSSADMSVLLAKAHALGLHALVTVFSEHLVSEAACLDWDAWKTASPDLIHRPLLDRLAADGRPMVISTGASTLNEVMRTHEWLRDHQAAFLQCVSAYPTGEDHASLRAIQVIASATGRICGYSDHTTSEYMGGLAVAAGASILEKHFTYSRTAAGPDHFASVDSAGMRRYIDFTHQAHRALGTSNTKELIEVEKNVRDVARQSVRAARRIPEGKRLELDDLVIKRPGDGVEPGKFSEVLGSRVVRNFEPDQPFKDGDWT